ncbi:MAG: zinc-binding protein [Eubacteriales bacterium]
MSETRICANCGAEHSIEDMFEVEGDWLCEDCADHLTLVCDHCGERFYEENAVEDDHTTLCEHCFDAHYTRCRDCGRIVRNYNAYFDEDDGYCSDCWAEHDEAIHEYSYTPDLVFHGKGLQHFGVELEIDNGGTVSSHAKQLLEIANRDAENLYIKTDGSLDEGLELVTHPMTPEYHLNEMPWAEVLRKARSMDYLSHAAGTCGLHVHISRLAFGCTYEQQEAAIARLLYFVEKFWAELLRFSRRTQSQMNRWAARYGIRLTPSEQMNHAKNSCAGRYTAVNLTNSDTVEIRMCRGTLKLNTLKATLQMVNHLVEVAVSMSDTAVQELSWFDFLDDVTEPELIQYLKERRLYVNEPVNANTEEA